MNSTTASSASPKESVNQKDRFPIAYSIVLACLAGGWLLRDKGLYTPEYGLGYWLGIIGGSMMLILLTYPIRKRIRWMRSLGATRYWFKIHMLFGLFGPLLVLFHSNFHLGSINSQVALFCMLIVSASGIVGKHLYSRIHHGLYGRKASLMEFQQELRISQENQTGIASVLPQLARDLELLSAGLLEDDAFVDSPFIRSLAWAMNRPIRRFKMKWAAKRELQLSATANPTIQNNEKRLLKTAYRHVDRQFSNMRLVARFTFYERLFSAWHVLHLPLFFMMILSAGAHIVAVHMY